MYWSTMVHQQQSWYIKRNTNSEVHYDTLAWRSFNIWEFLKYFCQYLKIESAIWPEAESIQNDDFPSSWWNDMSESVRQKNSLGKASEKSARRSIVTGRNYYLSIKIHSKKSELKVSSSTSAGGTDCCSFYLLIVPVKHPPPPPDSGSGSTGLVVAALDVGAVRREITVLIARGATNIRILSCPTLLWGKLDRSEE